MNKSMWALVFSIFGAGMSAQASEPNCPHPLLATGFDGERLSGDEGALARAAEAGVSLRVGWALDFDGDGVGDLTHWSDAIFVSIFEDRVFTQVQAIHRQRPRLSDARIELPDEMTVWHGLISSDGVLQGRFENASEVSARQVMTVWCKSDTAAPADAGWSPVYRSGLDGEALSGSKAELFNAIRAGAEVRIGWGLGRMQNGETRSVEHTADPVFLTIANDSDVVAQLPEHIAQRGYWGADDAFFDNGSVMWRGVVSTQGTFDAIWVDRASGEVVRRSPQRAVFTWYVQSKPPADAPSLAIEQGVTLDASREDEREPK